MRYDPEHKAQTRERILTEAAALIRLDGPERMGVAAVMKKAGLTHGGFYAHFASKEDLLEAAIGHMFDERYDAYFPNLDAPPRETLQRFIRWYLSPQHVEARHKGCPIPALAGEAHRMSEAAQRGFAAGTSRLIEAIAILIERLGTPKTIAITRSRLAVGQMVGAIMVARTLPDAVQAGEVLDAAREMAQAHVFGNMSNVSTGLAR